MPLKEKVRAVVFELNGESSSGLDGFTGTFTKTSGILLVMML